MTETQESAAGNGRFPDPEKHLSGNGKAPDAETRKRKSAGRNFPQTARGREMWKFIGFRAGGPAPDAETRKRKSAGRRNPETEKRRTQLSAVGIRKRKSAGRRNPQVLRDPRVRREAGGLDTSAEEKKARATQSRRVLLKDTAGSHEEAGQVAKATRPEKVFRLSSQDLLTALDGQLRATAGFGLGAFRPAPSEEPVPYASHRARVLTLCTDEASSNIALVCWMQWQAKLRVCHFRDPFHREWRDCQDAIKRAGLWHCVLLSTVLYNLSHGPWDGSAWFQKLREGAAEYWAKAEAGDPLVEVLYEPLCADLQEEAAGTPEHKLQVLSQAVSSSLVRKKGEKVALRRWFSWVGASQAHDRLWHSRLLLPPLASP
jgi:hypothetical protein